MSLVTELVTLLPMPQSTCTGTGTGAVANACNQGTKFIVFIKVFVVVVAMIFVLYVIAKSVKAGEGAGAIGKILLAALAAGLGVWVVFNVDFLSGQVGKDINPNGAPAIVEPFDLGNQHLML
jgi:predicted RND superfamily exporter protein